MRLIKTFAALSFMLASAGPLLAVEDAGFRNLTVDQAKVYHAGSQKQSSLRLTAWVDRHDMTYARGETLKLNFKTNEDAYVTVFNVGPTGKITQLFPNAFQKDNLVKAGHDTVIPSAKSKAEIRVSDDEVGAEMIKVIASDKPLKLVAEKEPGSGEVFLVVKGDVSEFVRNLEVTTAQPASANKISIVNIAIKTIASR